MGEKLQALVDGACISHSFAEGLTSTQKAAIEALEWSYIWALREVRERVGAISGSSVV
jgi:hypothetical protein